MSNGDLRNTGLLRAFDAGSKMSGMGNLDGFSLQPEVRETNIGLAASSLRMKPFVA
jgi:hypothetical protein